MQISWRSRRSEKNRKSFRIALPLAAALFVLTCGASPSPADKNSDARMKAFAKLPDWSGIWQLEGSFRTFEPLPESSGAAGANAGKSAPSIAGAQPGSLLRDHPPYTPEWEAKYEVAFKNLDDNADTNTRYCAAGFPRLMAAPFLFEIFVEPQETVMTFEQREVRHIYTDGRSHPAEEDLWPMLWGDSIGHWEGEMLVVDTVSMKPDVWLDPTAIQLSEKAHVVERIRQTGLNELEDQLTIEDPIAFTGPWKVTRKYKKVTITNRLIDQVCQENERNPVVNGKNSTIVK